VRVSHRRPRIVVADEPGPSLNTAISILGDLFDVVAVANNADAAIEATLSLRADVVVVNAALDHSGAPVWAKQLGMAGPYPRIVLVSSDIYDTSVLAALERGVAAVVATARMTLDLPAAVSQVHAGGRFIPSAALLPRWLGRLERRHDLQLYRTDRHLLGAVASFFATAFEAGDSVLAIATPPLLEELDAYVASHQFDPAALRAVGRYYTIDSSAALAAVCRNGVPDPALYAAEFDPLVERALTAATGAVPRVTAFGQIAPILCERGEFDAVVRLERIADAYAAAHPVSLLCGYSTKCLGGDDERLVQIRHEHVTVVPADAPA
jgi:hypothetical protein